MPVSSLEVLFIGSFTLVGQQVLVEPPIDGFEPRCVSKYFDMPFKAEDLDSFT